MSGLFSLSGLTWSIRLQVPGPSWQAGQDGGGWGGVDRTDGLHVTFFVFPQGDVQNGDGDTLVQLSRVQEHLREAQLTRAQPILQGAAQTSIVYLCLPYLWERIVVQLPQRSELASPYHRKTWGSGREGHRSRRPPEGTFQDSLLQEEDRRLTFSFFHFGLKPASTSADEKQPPLSASFLTFRVLRTDTCLRCPAANAQLLTQH